MPRHGEEGVVLNGAGQIHPATGSGHRSYSARYGGRVGGGRVQGLDTRVIGVREPVQDLFSRDVRGLGHHGTDDLEVAVEELEDLEEAKPLIEKSFEAS